MSICLSVSHLQDCCFNLASRTFFLLSSFSFFYCMRKRLFMVRCRNATQRNTFRPELLHRGKKEAAEVVIPFLDVEPLRGSCSALPASQPASSQKTPGPLAQFQRGSTLRRWLACACKCAVTKRSTRFSETT